MSVWTTLTAYIPAQFVYITGCLTDEVSKSCPFLPQFRSFMGVFKCNGRSSKCPSDDLTKPGPISRRKRSCWHKVTHHWPHSAVQYHLGHDHIPHYPQRLLSYNSKLIEPLLLLFWRYFTIMCLFTLCISPHHPSADKGGYLESYGVVVFPWRPAPAVRGRGLLCSCTHRPCDRGSMWMIQE